MGTLFARIGFTRNQYQVSPGLYAVGHPASDAPFLVTANYKLSFDALRFNLDGVDAWLLVIDTRGINVWCAAGKGTFSTEEVIFSVEQTGIKEINKRPTLILPQLAATGVCALKVEKGCGVRALFGPILTRDLPQFLQENTATEEMRCVTFTMRERAVLIPVELYLLFRPFGLFALAAFLFSGIGPDIFSFSHAWQRGLVFMQATILGLFSGSFLVPILLPWLYGRQFWVKGLWPGLVLGALFAAGRAGQSTLLEQLALFLLITTISSYQGMHFTGCTPFTSLSGVDYEMRRGIPFQMLLLMVGFMLWISAPFI